METKPAIFIPGETGEVSDGYHTFNELYEHRHALFLALVKQNREFAWRSRTHSDGKGIDGWFIAGLDLPGGAISYHLPERLWSAMYGVLELERAPMWDGHTSKDVVERLMNWAKTEA